MKKEKKIIKEFNLTLVKGYFLDENEPVSSSVRILGTFKSTTGLKKAVKEQTGRVLLHCVEAISQKEKRELSAGDFVKYSKVVLEEGEK